MSNSIIIKYKKFDDTKDFYIPKYATEGASGMDLRSAITTYVYAKDRVIIPTNICVEIPEGYELQIRPRSGLAAKHGITVLNTPGTIDSDYRGEIKVILYNTSNTDYLINSGDRIAQMVLAKVEKIELYADNISDTNRGEGGFGSTGIK